MHIFPWKQSGKRPLSPISSALKNASLSLRPLTGIHPEWATPMHGACGMNTVLFSACCTAAGCAVPRHAGSGQGTLTIVHSKGDKDRVVYLSDDVRELLCRYRDYLTGHLGYLPFWFFPSRHPEKPVHKATLDRRFNMAWNQTPFSGTTSKKPTVHSLRHSFVVDRMNSWLEEGLPYDRMLPYLSRYLGHSGIEESMYYYHLDERANILIRKGDRAAGRVIPEVKKYGH